jgi:ketose-bisphosphate aldolase
VTPRAAQRTELRELLHARRRVPILAANVNEQQDLRAAVEAAYQARAPLIVMVSPRTIEHSGLDTIAQMFRSLTAHGDLPVWLQLDHACDLALISECIAAGFDIVMADYSQEPFAENVRKVRDVMHLARATDVLVEGEVGAIPEGGVADRDGDGLTTPDEARDFAARTAVDFLAVSVGNSHGFERRKPRLDLDRIRAIAGATTTPLVLHGGDYYPGEEIAEAVRAGMTKVNVGPELREAYCIALRSGVDACDWNFPDHRPILDAARTAVRDALLRRFSDLAAADKVGPAD